MSSLPRRLAAFAFAFAFAVGLLAFTAPWAGAQDASPNASADGSAGPSASAAATAAPTLAPDQALVRVLNGSPDSSSIDIYLDGTPVAALSGIAFGAISDYAVVQAGSHDLKIFDSGADPSVDQPRYTTTVSLDAGSSNTLTATDLLAALQLQTLVDTPTPVARKAQLRIVQYSADLPAGDIAPVGKDALVTNLAYPAAGPYLTVPAGSYVLEARPGGDASAALQLPPATLGAGRSYSVFVVGSATGAEDAQGLTAVVALDATYQPPTTAQVRFLHASPDAEGLDVYLDGARVEALTGITYGTVSDRFEVPAGTRTITLFQNGADPGTATPLLAADFDFQPGQAYTVAAANRLSKLSMQLLKDDPSPLADKAQVRYVNLSADAPAVDIAPDGKAAIVSKLAYPKAGQYITTDAGSLDLEVRQAGRKKVLLQLDPISLAAGTSSSVFLIGSAKAAADAQPLSVVVAVDASAAP